MKSFLTLLLATLCALPVAAQKKNHNFDVVKNLDIFNSLYRELDLYYVDTLDAKENIENATAYMLSHLDMYTEYYPEDDTDELRQLTTGKYAGIGSVISYKEGVDRCVIAEPYEGMPAARAGLLPGDIILSIGGKDIEPCGKGDRRAYSNDVSSRLRGDAGTTFELKVRRPTTARTLTFKITRQSILMPSVTVRKILNDSIGYLHITQFIDGTANDVRHGIAELKQKGAKRLIVDLRGNPGGLIDEAVKTVNLFIPRGREVVSTKGKVKEANNTYKTTSDPLDAEIPVAVLVDFGSASASEITSGALQDYDRAVIIGSRTYGKGLVQQSRKLPYNGILKLTTGKYYIPSGRCVQAYEFKDGLPVHLPDSLSKAFRTANGRLVRDCGGITPDIEVKEDSLPRLLYYLEVSDQLFNYCVDYRAAHPTIAWPDKFTLSGDEYSDFCTYLKKNKFTYDRQSLRALEQLRKVAQIEGYDADASAELDALEAKLKHNEDYDFKRWEKEIRQIVEKEIVKSYYYQDGAEEYLLRNDPALERAIQTLSNSKLLQRVLSGEPEA